MKKIFILVFVLICVFNCFAQSNRTLQIQDYPVSDALKQYLPESQIEQMRLNDPVKLITMNRTIYGYALVIDKLWENDFNPKGYLEDYLPKGMTYSEDEIIDQGYVNPYVWNLPQDNEKWNLFKLRMNGYYVVVMPKTELDARINAQLLQYGITK